MGLISHYLRVFIRSNFKPMNPIRAQIYHNKLTIAYFVLGWSIFGTTVYELLKMLRDPNNPIKQRDGKLLTVYDVVKQFGREENNTIVHISGLTKVSEEQMSRAEAASKAMGA